MPATEYREPEAVINQQEQLDRMAGGCSIIMKSYQEDIYMALPSYDKTKRRKSFEQLPKGAYVVKILKGEEVQNKNNNGSHLLITFDIAEGEYRDFYKNQYEQSTNENKKYSPDAYFRLTVPADNSPTYVWDSWNSFFADLEDSNNGYVFAGNPADLRGKIIGGKFHNEQSEYNGNVYDHTRLRWTCVADDVRNGKPGKMPNDKLIEKKPLASDTGFMPIPEAKEEDVPFL